MLDTSGGHVAELGHVRCVVALLTRSMTPDGRVGPNRASLRTSAHAHHVRCAASNPPRPAKVLNFERGSVWCARLLPTRFGFASLKRHSSHPLFFSGPLP